MWVVYCSDRLDGVLSAAVIARAARIRGVSFKFGGAFGFDKIGSLAGEISADLNSVLFFLDLSPDSIPNLASSLEISRRGCVVGYWACHSAVSSSGMDLIGRFVRVSDIVGPSKDCTTALVQRRFLPSDPVASVLSSLSSDFVFWLRKDKRAWMLDDLLSSGFDVKQLIDGLSKGIFWCDSWNEIRSEYLLKRSRWVDELMDSLIIRAIGGVRFGFSFAPKGLDIVEAGRHVLDRHDGVDVSVVLSRECRISFRARDQSGFDLSRLTSDFDGHLDGPCVRGSGSRYFSSVSIDQFSRAVSELEVRLRLLS